MSAPLEAGDAIALKAAGYVVRNAALSAARAARRQRIRPKRTPAWVLWLERTTDIWDTHAERIFGTEEHRSWTGEDQP